MVTSGRLRKEFPGSIRRGSLPKDVDFSTGNVWFEVHTKSYTRGERKDDNTSAVALRRAGGGGASKKEFTVPAISGSYMFAAPGYLVVVGGYPQQGPVDTLQVATISTTEWGWAVVRPDGKEPPLRYHFAATSFCGLPSTRGEKKNATGGKADTTTRGPGKYGALVCGGVGHGDVLFNDLYELKFEAGGAQCSWTAVGKGQSSVTKRFGHTIAISGDIVLLFGGCSGRLYGGFSPADLRNDLWMLDLGGSRAWRECQGNDPDEVSQPPPRVFHSMGTCSRRTMIFGGQGEGGRCLNDTWVLAENSYYWRMIDGTAASPSPRMLHSSCVDDAMEAVVVFGGGDFNPYNDIHCFHLGSETWSKVPVSSTARVPAPRARAALCKDNLRPHFYLFGGVAGSTRLGDVWAFQLPYKG